MKTQWRRAIPFLIGIFVFAFSSPITVALSAQSLHSGLIAYYTFDDGTAKDKSGHGNNGAVYGTTSTTGIVGNAFRFNGFSDYIQVPYSPLMSLSNEFTITGWARPFATSGNGYVVILTKGNTSSLRTPYAVVYSAQGGSLVPHVRFTSDQGVHLLTNLPINNSLTLNNWNFYVWRYANSKLEIFNGTTKLGERDLSLGTLASNTLPLEIGRDIPGATEFYQGDLDEIRIYNRAISDAEIQQIYQQGLKPTGYLTSPEDNISLGPATLLLTAEVLDTSGIGVKRVEFVVFYDGLWRSAGIDETSSYEGVWQTPNKLRSQQIQFGIHIVDAADNKIEFAGGIRRVNYLEYLGNPDAAENWVPTRAYLNQRSLKPSGDSKCSVASMAMMLAMNGIISQEYIVMRDKANEMYPKVLDANGNAYVGYMTNELNRQGMTARASSFSVDNAWNTLQQEIDNGRPVIIRTAHGVVTEAGHFFVAVGYRNTTDTRQVIAYDPFGRWKGTCCTGNYDLNSTEAGSRKGQWVSYNFDKAFGKSNWLITAQPKTVSQNTFSLPSIPSTPPDSVSDEPENISTYTGVTILVDAVYLPLIRR